MMRLCYARNEDTEGDIYSVEKQHRPRVERIEVAEYIVDLNEE